MGSMTRHMLREGHLWLMRSVCCDVC